MKIYEFWYKIKNDSSLYSKSISAHSEERAFELMDNFLRLIHPENCGGWGLYQVHG